MRSEVPKQTKQITAAETTYSDVLSLEQADLGNVEATLDITAIAGLDFTLDVTTQYSYDKVKWFDHTTKVFSQVTHASSLDFETLDINTNAMYTRWKYVTVGAGVDVTFDLYSCGM